MKERMMSKIENGPSEPLHKLHEDVAAEVCMDASVRNDKELDGPAGEPAALTDNELDAVTGGGTVNHSEFHIVKLLDAATPKLVGVPGGHVKVFSGADI